MRILIISQYFWPESVRLNDLAQGLVENGHTVTVLTGKPNYPQGEFYSGYNFLSKSQEFFHGVKIIRVPLVPRGKNSNIRLAINYLSFVFFASLIAPFKCKKADVIFVHAPSPITVGLPALLLKKISGTPVLLWVQDLWPESVSAVGAIRSTRVLRLIQRLVQFIYSRSDYILMSSKGYFEAIKKFVIAEKKLHYFPLAAAALYKPIDPVLVPEEAKILPSGFRLIFAGNIGIAQDIATLLEAATILKNTVEIKWIFLGEGSQRIWLQEEIKKRGLSTTVYWLGLHPVETMPNFFAHADVLLVSLKSEPVFTITIPSKIQSYLACAKPIIAALDGEGAKIIEEANAGITTPAGDSFALSNAVLKMYNLSTHEREIFGQAGRYYFEQHFEENKLLIKLENWMHELIINEGVVQ